MRFISQSVILLIVLISIQTNAQVFVKGTVQRNGKDVDGYIAYRVKQKKPELYFKASEQGVAEKIDLSTIEGFRFTDYMDVFNVNQDSAGKTTVERMVTEGEITVYSNALHYRLSKKSTGEEVVLSRVRKENANARVLQRVRNAGTLSNLTSDCDLKGRSTNIVSAVEQYNKCRGSFHREKNHAVRLNAVAGVNITNASFSGDLLYLSKAKFESGIGYHTGVGITRVPLSYLSRVSLHVDVIYMQTRLKGHADYRIFGPRSVHDISIDYSTLRAPVSLSIFFQQANRGFYISPGVSPFIFLDYSTSRKSHLVLGNGDVIDQQEYEDLFQRYKQNDYNAGFFAEIGYLKDLSGNSKVKAALRIEHETGRLHKTSPIISTIINYYVTVHYQL